MTDFALHQADDISQYNLDIDIVDGEAVLLPQASYTAGQRATVASYIAKGSVPGWTDLGIDWGAVYSGDLSALVNINNSASENVQKYVGENYTPFIVPSEEGFEVTINR